MQQAITELEPLLTLKETMDYLRVSRSTLLRMVESGEVPARKVGAHWRFYASELKLKQVVQEPERIQMGGSIKIQAVITDIAGKQHALAVRQITPDYYSVRLGDYEASGTSVETVASKLVSAINHNHPRQFEQEADEHQQQLLDWITTCLRPGKRGKSRRYSSYYLKHVAEQVMHRYVGNGEIKGALLKAGYIPVENSQEYDVNWDFTIERGIPEMIESALHETAEQGGES